MWALTAFAGVVLLGTLEGIVVAIVVSLFALAHQVSDPPVYALGRKRGTNVFRRDRRASRRRSVSRHVAAASGRADILRQCATCRRKDPAAVREAKPEIVVLDLGGVFDVEYTALKMMIEAEQRLPQSGVTLWLAGLNPGVLAAVRRSPLGERSAESACSITWSRRSPTNRRAR